MGSVIEVSVFPETAAVPHLLAKWLSENCNHDGPYHILKRSIDSRQRQVKVQLKIELLESGEFPGSISQKISFPDVSGRPEAVIIGAGPAGLFAALSLIQQGIRPMVYERGKDVRERRRDLVAIHREGKVNPDSNYCFGEGGAGTFSDGKLYTRSTKRGDVRQVLDWFVHFGASADILVDAHPHIGTNKLPGIISAMREQIRQSGGEIHFGYRFSGFHASSDKRTATLRFTDVSGGPTVSRESGNVILATGHSARDIFRLLLDHGVSIEFKPFALGVRVEHPQALIDRLQYHCESRGDFLPPAAYQLVYKSEKYNAYSFCMCPGGIIAPCATAPGEVVTNGWSPSKRNNPWANSGMVVPVGWEEVAQFHSEGPLAGMAFQHDLEAKCWAAAGNTQAVPAQTIADFMEGRMSAHLPPCSYQPGVVSSRVDLLLPGFVTRSLRKAFADFDRKMPGFVSADAVVVAPESRTSSPVRIPRDHVSCRHPEAPFLLPCAEGAGYAGGIVSAALDGIRCATSVATNTQIG
ncbi:MAG: FAD-binding protein [Flavobacteriales bacterium]|nr:FAD-binding protein [Flavobacteriales bacterium]